MIALFDSLALEVMEVAARLGLAIPGDLSVIGFDDVPAAALAPPGLTTFDAEIKRSAVEIAGMLARAIAEPEAEVAGDPAAPPAAGAARQPRAGARGGE